MWHISYILRALLTRNHRRQVVVWVRDSDLVTVHGYGGNASPFSNRSRYHAGWPGGPTDYPQYMPSLFRVQRSTRVRFANLIGATASTTAACR
jgi:hypothetical protein